jgi:hypothetical protein
VLAPAKRARYCRTFSVTPLRPKCRSLGDDRSRAGRARRSLSSCPSVAAGIGSRILTWSHVPRKFTRLSHLSVGVTRNPVFSSFRSGAPVGSIPIARSTFHSLAWPYVAIGHVRASSAVPTLSIPPGCPTWRVPQCTLEPISNLGSPPKTQTQSAAIRQILEWPPLAPSCVERVVCRTCDAPLLVAAGNIDQRCPVVWWNSHQLAKCSFRATPKFI